MKSTRKLVVGIAAVASLGLAAAAFSQPAPGSGYGPGAGMGPMGMNAGQAMPGAMGPGAMRHGPMGAGAMGPGGNFDPAAMLETRMTYVKSALKITAGQESYWNAYSEAVKAQVAAMKAAHTAATQTQTPPAPAPERVAKHLTLMQAHLTDMQTNVLPAMRSLYGSLTDEQKVIADNVLGKPQRGFRKPAQ